jgi:hypothetical protein
MKRALTVGLVLGLATSLVAAETTRREQKAEQEVRKAEGERVKALLDQDWA